MSSVSVRSLLTAAVTAVFLFAAGAGLRAETPGQSEVTTGCDSTRDWLTTMIGQMLMFGFSGTETTQAGPGAIRRNLCTGVIGGVILLGHNVVSKAQVKRLTGYFKGAGAQMTPLIAVDQEGGKVQRLGTAQGYAAIPHAASVASDRSLEDAFELYLNTARQVRNAGFNVNFGPVVDVNVNRDNPIIGRYGRSFSADPATVIAYSKRFITAHHRTGVLTALKHFPGHGSSRNDSHKDFVDITDTWKKDRELAPFAALANDSRFGDMVMVGHLYHAGLSPGGRDPATLSDHAINGLLRRQMGYQGVVITDDLEMGAIRKSFGFRETVIKAIRAGNDILLISNSADPDLELPEKVITIVKEAVTRGEIDMATIEASFERIMKLKQKLAHLEQQMAARE